MQGFKVILGMKNIVRFQERSKYFSRKILGIYFIYLFECIDMHDDKLAEYSIIIFFDRRCDISFIINTKKSRKLNF